MDPLKFVKDNTYGINQLNISPDKKVDKLLVRFAGICGAIAAQPIPFADIFILTPIQLYMGTLIAEARGYKFSISEIYKEILGLIGLAYLAQQTAIGLYKTILPFLGAITTIPLVFILTYAIGKVMDYYFVSKTEGKKVTKDDLIKVFKEARKDAKKNFTKDEIRKKTNAAKADMANYKPATKEFVQKNIDELAVISVISKLRSGEKIVSEEETVILEAMIRSSNKITDLDSAINFAKTTAAKGADSLMGAANNIKGIAHELIYIKTENDDGDSVFAFMPEDTNHPQFDVLTINNATGEQKWEQLKTTTNPENINSWIEKYPGSEGSLKVNIEMADKLGFESTSISDKELTIDVNNFLDKLIQMDENALAQIIETSPPLTIIAASFVVYGLYKRYQQDEISKKQFISMSAKITGIKAAKIVMLLSLLALPGIGQVVAVYLISSLMFSAIGIFEIKKEKLLLPAPIK
ncbi:YcjF family protein [Candidatus Pelagibacter sp. HIMB1321]|uniref:YcjF family protein n=1 Tax=Candidatus Pelagibacter sp. HIMB1321 TaxID=1388755 RepID=UPI000A07DC0E|nr:hypothetical protein [Candidatus Pelagibacter sp. HIMB1321]SMF72072.1 Uncharacterized conserved protein, DUF697 family [Candidatus Pelagibacter sp. HIMB1321]